jgi:hypothetical protein
MDAKEFVIVVGSFSLVFIPAMALTARFALKPIVESIIRLREGFSTPVAPAFDAKRVELLEREVEDLKAQLSDLQVQREFDRAFQ